MMKKLFLISLLLLAGGCDNRSANKPEPVYKYRIAYSIGPDIRYVYVENYYINHSSVEFVDEQGYHRYVSGTFEVFYLKKEQ